MRSLNPWATREVLNSLTLEPYLSDPLLPSFLFFIPFSPPQYTDPPRLSSCCSFLSPPPPGSPRSRAPTPLIHMLSIIWRLGIGQVDGDLQGSAHTLESPSALPTSTQVPGKESPGGAHQPVLLPIGHGQNVCGLQDAVDRASRTPLPGREASVPGRGAVLGLSGPGVSGS